MADWFWTNPDDKWITFQEFILEYVCEKKIFTDAQVHEWLDKYNLSIRSKVRWVSHNSWREDWKRLHENSGYVIGEAHHNNLHIFVSNLVKL